MLTDEVSQNELRSNAPWKRLKNSSLDCSSLNTNLSQPVFDSQDVYTQNSQSPSRKFYQRYMQKRTFQSTAHPTQDSGKGNSANSASIIQERDNVSALLTTILNTINNTASKTTEQFHELHADIQELKVKFSELDTNQRNSYSDVKNVLEALDNTKTTQQLEQILSHVSLEDTKVTQMQSKMNEEFKKVETIVKQIRQLHKDINVLKTELLDNLRKEILNCMPQWETFQQRFLRQQQNVLDKITEFMEMAELLQQNKQCSCVCKSGCNSSVNKTPIRETTTTLFPKNTCKLGWENKWMSPAYSFQALKLPQRGIIQGTSAKRQPMLKTSKEPNFAPISEEQVNCELSSNSKKKKKNR